VDDAAATRENFFCAIDLAHPNILLAGPNPSNNCCVSGRKRAVNAGRSYGTSLDSSFSVLITWHVENVEGDGEPDRCSGVKPAKLNEVTRTNRHHRFLTVSSMSRSTRVYHSAPTPTTLVMTEVSHLLMYADGEWLWCTLMSR
jgi:hypothetical protein